MASESETPAPDTPRWVWLLLLCLGMTQPLNLLWVEYFPPEGLLPTGLHIPDSALFLYAMDMFPTGFHSDYATCAAATGTHAIAYYSVPHLWLYGVLGLLYQIMPLPKLIFYGCVNGLAYALYLYVVFQFLCTFAPRVARTAFLLFALSGGPGGLLCFAGLLLGPEAQANYNLYADRFFLYTVYEGAHLNPLLYATRAYYTLSLAGLLGAMTLLQRQPSYAMTAAAALLALAASFLNARFGLFTTAIFGLFLMLSNDPTKKLRIQAFAAFALPAGLGCGLSALLMRLNPIVVQNHMEIGAMAMWFSAFLVAVPLHLAIGASALKSVAVASQGFAPRVLRALLGYLAVYGVAYLGYQMYYGNLLVGRDGSVAAAISDWALVGLAAALLPSKTKATPSPHEGALTFHATWFLLFFAVSISGWGQGWFLRFGPQRLEPLLWLPLCALVAFGLHGWTPNARKLAMGTLLALGLSSMVAALATLQGPAHRTAQPYSGMHMAYMTTADGALLESLPTGRVLAPWPLGDIIAYNKRQPVVFGTGSFNLTDRPHSVLATDVNRFFAPGTDEATRKAIVQAYCAEVILLADGLDLDLQVGEALRSYGWLTLQNERGRGAVFTVNQSPAG